MNVEWSMLKEWMIKRRKLQKIFRLFFWMNKINDQPMIVAVERNYLLLWRIVGILCEYTSSWTNNSKHSWILELAQMLLILLISSSNKWICIKSINILKAYRSLLLSFCCLFIYFVFIFFVLRERWKWIRIKWNG